MKVGLYSISCSGTWFNDRPALTVEEFMDTAKKYGYEGVEIDLKRPHGSPLDLDEKRCKEIKAYADKLGLEICAVAANNCFASIVPEQLENELLMVREQIKIAKMLGAPVLRVFAAWRGIVKRDGIATYEVTHTPNYWGALKYQLHQSVAACLKECVKWAEEAGVVLALQNHEPIIENYQDMLDFVAEINSPWLKCCFDAPCCGYYEEVQTDEYIRNATLAVGKLQMITHANAEFKENADGSVEMIHYDNKMALTNYPMFIKTLKEVGYEGWLTYEFCHMPFHDGKVLGYNDYIDNQIRLAKKYFQNLVDTL